MTIPVLFKRHFQIAYVVDDVEAAAATLSQQYGIGAWDILDMTALHGPHSPARLIGNAWVGDLMIEVIEPQKDVKSIYSDWQPSSGAALRFHHLGFLIDSEEEFNSAKRSLTESGFPIVTEGTFGEVLDYAYADTTAELGHYYEMIRLKAEGQSFFGRIPVN